jgi:hypothetical protein
LKTVAQKLVAIESFSAKIASGAVSADQKRGKPLPVPKMKIDASGRNTSGSMRTMSVPILNGLTTSKPCTCRIVETAALIFLHQSIHRFHRFFAP